MQKIRRVPACSRELWPNVRYADTLVTPCMIEKGSSYEFQAVALIMKGGLFAEEFQAVALIIKFLWKKVVETWFGRNGENQSFPNP